MHRLSVSAAFALSLMVGYSLWSLATGWQAGLPGGQAYCLAGENCAAPGVKWNGMRARAQSHFVPQGRAPGLLQGTQ